MARVLDALVIVIAFGLVAFFLYADHHVTIRAIRVPYGDYVVAYDAKGGAVYITRGEWLAINGSFACAVLIVICRAIWSFIFRKKPQIDRATKNIGIL
jgi:hypothetical protein